MALATTNFEVGLVQLAIQNGSVFSTARPVAPTFSMLLGVEPEMADNLISGVSGVPTYGALSDAEINAGIIQTFIANNPAIGGDVARGTFGVSGTGMGAAVTPTQSEILESLAFRTTYYSDKGQTISMARMREGLGTGWAANMSYEQLLATQMVEKYIRDRSSSLFLASASGLPGDGQFGSLRAMITDGLTGAARNAINPSIPVGATDESAYATYGNLSRATNANVRSQYIWAASAAFSETIAQRAALAAFANGAGTVVAPMSLGRFAAFEYALRSGAGSGYGQIRIDEKIRTVINGGQAIEAYGVIFYPEPALPATTTWQLFLDLGRAGMPNVMAKTGMQKSAVEHIANPGLEAADRLRWVFPDQCIVRNPKSCVLVEGLTAA
jgi:hypothetical protein